MTHASIPRVFAEITAKLEDHRAAAFTILEAELTRALAQEEIETFVVALDALLEVEVDVGDAASGTFDDVPRERAGDARDARGGARRARRGRRS